MSDLGLRAIGLHRTLRRHPWSRPQTVVRDLDLEVRSGEIVGLLGPNGAGKTTTFRMLAGLLKAQRGRVELAGRDITRLPLWRRARAGLGYLPQRPTLLPDLTARQNVALGLGRQGLSHSERGHQAEALLERFSLGHVMHAPGGTLSGGERRRVEIIRALAAQPRVLLVDEPFAGLDPKAADEVVAQLRAITAHGTGVLLTDHHVGRAFNACERAYVLHSGALLLEGDPETIASDARVRQIWLGDAFGSASSDGAHRPQGR
ncbi:MAG: LPS export ABC transporter ATP-binding protein [Bradymonadia bacterium]